MDDSCIICGSREFCEIYPEKLSADSFSPYAFSARGPYREAGHCQIVKCPDCGLVRFNNVITEDEAEALYKQSYYLYEDESEYVVQTYFDLFSGLAESLHGDRRVLEIVCGDGGFLEKLADAGVFEVTGIEPCQSAVSRAASSIRSKIITEMFRLHDVKEDSFSLVAAFHLVDHLFSSRTLELLLQKAGFQFHKIGALANRFPVPY